MGLVPLQKMPCRSTSPRPPCEEAARESRWKRATPDTERDRALVLDFTASRIMRNRCLLLISHSICGIFDLVAGLGQRSP
jgi:hypothetical protein